MVNENIMQIENHDRTRDWSIGMGHFHRVLSSLTEITSKHADGGPSGGSDTEECDRDDQFEPSPKSDKSKKRKKSSKKSKKEKKDGSKRSKKSTKKDSKSKEEGSPLPDDVKKKATHLGRFKKRETAKMVKGYSSNDLAAILGEDPFQKQDLEHVTSGLNSSSPSRLENNEKILLNEEGKVSEEDPESINAEPTWWDDYFVKGPRAGSERLKRAVRHKGFSEKDQENLYTSAHDDATQGKSGLGRSSMPKKVAGTRWSGKKTKFDEEDGDHGEGQESDDGPVMDDYIDEDKKGIQIILPTRNKETSTSTQSWISAATQILQQEGKSMKLKSLVKAILKGMGNCGIPKDEAKKKILEALESETQYFRVRGKVVSLNKTSP